MNHTLKVYSSADLEAAYTQAKGQMELLSDGNTYSALEEFCQDILEILNHRGVRLKL